MKHCNACGQDKPSDQFHIRAVSKDGLSAKCRACQAVYDKARLEKPDRVAARKAYQATEQGKQKQRQAGRRWDSKNGHKKYAQGVVAKAVRSGKLIRQPCERCGHSEYVEAHHDDYSKPLDVMWLCDFHHKQRHKELRAVVSGETT